MNREDLELLENRVMEEVVKRRRLGGYSAEAEGVLLLSETMLKIVQHLREKASRSK